MHIRRLPFRFTLFALASFVLVTAGAVAAQTDPEAQGTSAPPMHPTFPLLDAGGQNVLKTGAAVSSMTTCGGCHDTAFIAANNFHVEARPAAAGYPGGGLIADLTTPEWLMAYGARYVGGPITDGSAPGLGSGAPVAWDWTKSGTAELNCFLCHLPGANNEARVAALEAGQFGDAVTATLVGSGIVEAGDDGSWSYNAEAFDATGALKPELVNVSDPGTSACGNCHGVTHTDQGTPLTLDDLSPGDWTTLTTGQVMSPQRIAASGLNLAGKEALGRSWDVHMERVLECTNCHYSLNNPVYYQAGGDQPEHLQFDPRRIDLGEYIYRPLHQFAKGQSAQGTLAPSFDATLRRCESCHSAELTHDWLPYTDRHMAAVACESCHVPRLYAPALRSVDWTVLDAAGEPVRSYRGLEGDALAVTSLITGFEPVLLPRANRDGTTSLAPFNLVSSWFWATGDPAQPVALRDLRAAYFEGDAYAPTILTAFDADGDNELSESELSITSDAQVAAVRARLAATGVAEPRIVGEVQPYGIHHNVAEGSWVTRECRECHGTDSRLAAAFTLSGRTPGGVKPALYEGGPVSWPGEIVAGEGGVLRFAPDTAEAGLYVLGHNASRLIDWLGVLMVLGVGAGALAHGGLRVLAARRRAKAAGDAAAPLETRKVYMYDLYERLWHWLQTAAILLLLFTGLIIHKPDLFGIFSFRYVVQVHNILALLLVINAALSLFYHLTSGEIRQFIPRPRGFFDQAAQQAIFYVRGIFRKAPHPFEKSRERKLNPLQQVTYVIVLNVLLPLQIITGGLMWGAQRWPGLAQALGGLPALAIVHTLVAWTFAAFIILHVYLTTTGPTPATGMKAMMMGYEVVEAPASHGDAGTAHASTPVAGTAD